MKIDHLAIWVSDLERMRSFYEKYFYAEAGIKYVNSAKNFQSYFLTFKDGCRLELMNVPGLAPSSQSLDKPSYGIVHFAISLGSEEEVNRLTEVFKEDGYHVKGEPRYTGDGYYESVILDPEHNIIELTV